MLESQKGAPDEEQLRRRVDDAHAAFRQALLDYRQGTGRPADYLLEKSAPRLRDDAFAHGRLFSDRHVMMRELATGRRGAEVGVQHGNFARFILSDLPVAELHLFEMNTALISADVRENAKVVLHGGDSSMNLGRLPDAHLDWIYIDGDHSYAGALKDARTALSKVRSGGYLFFNDYTLWSFAESIPYGVMAVANELANEGHDVVGLALNHWGYFDLALRRA